MKSKKSMIIVAVVMVVVLGAIAVVGILRDFDAKSYVNVILKQTYFGEVEEATNMIHGASEEQLRGQYEAGVQAFVKVVTPPNAELSEEQEKQYFEVCKKIFKKMKFEVGKEEKISDKEYCVSVTYQSSNVIEKYLELISQEQARMNDKVEKGEYKGTKEEINQQMQQEFLTNAAALLEEACNSMEYGEKQTMIFEIVEGENELYQIKGEEMTEFLEKILKLEEKED